MNAFLQSNYPKDKTIPTLFETHAAKSPHSIAACFEKQTLTYQQLNEKANQLAHYLQRQGARPGALISVCMQSTTNTIVTLLAILKSGGAYIPIDPNYPEARIQYILEDSRSCMLITDRINFSKLKTLTNSSLTLLSFEETQKTCQKESQNNPTVTNQPEDLAYVIYTSGTTGQPKGIMISHRNVAHLLIQNNYIHIKSNDRIAQVCNIAFDAAVVEIWGALLNGAAVYIIPKEYFLDVNYFTQWLNQHKITILFLTTAFFNSLAEKTKELFNGLRYLLFGGEAANTQTVNTCLSQKKPSLKLLNCYGPAEVTTMSTCYEVPESIPSLETVPIGTAIDNIETYILDEHLKQVSPGQPGELYLGGDGLALGYLHRPELTAERFIQHPFNHNPIARLYKTGDIVRELPDSNIEYIGRIDTQVKIRGHRIELGEIEASLLQHPEIKHCAVVAKTANDQKYLAAYLVLHKEIAKVSLQELHEFLLKKLPNYMIPSAFIALKELPLTPNLKVDKKYLQNFQEGERLYNHNYVAPTNTFEKSLLLIFSACLNVPAQNISTQDNFFELGGNSITAIKIIARARETWHVDINIKEFFESPNIATLAKKIETQTKTDHLTSTDIIPTIRRNQLLPLSLAQQKLWFLAKLEPDNPFYNEHFMLELSGDLNITALKQAISSLVIRHEIFRTHIIERKGSGYQKILPTVDIERIFCIEDDSSLSEESLQREINQKTFTAFKMKNNLLYRFFLFKCKDNVFIFLCCIHHILIDGWSIDILYRELSQLYQSFQQNTPFLLPPLSIQPADYAAWEQQEKNQLVFKKQLSYWKKTLTQAIPIQFPTDYSTSKLKTREGKSLLIEVSETTTNRLVALSRTHQVSLYTTIFSVMNVLLFRYSNDTDITIGTATANRKYKVLENLVGFFANTLVFRTVLSPEFNFIDLLKINQEIILNAQNNSDVPFDKLVEILKPSREKWRNPFFHIYLGLEPSGTYQPQLTQKTIIKEIPKTHTKFDLGFLLKQENNKIIGTFEYSTELFTEGTAKKILHHFYHLLQTVIEYPQNNILSFELFDNTEKHRLLSFGKGPTTSTYLAKNLQEAFELQAQKNPQMIALVFEDKSITYQTLNERSNQFACYLKKHGVTRDVLVPICIERNIELIIALLGILKAGGAYVPIHPHLPDERKTYIFKNTGFPFLLTLADIEKSQVEQIDPVSYVNHPQDLAYVIHTSGSTGVPKGVLLPHETILNLSQWQMQQYAKKPQKVAQFAPIGFDVSLQEIFLALLYGAELHLVPEETRKSMVDLLDFINKNQIDTLFLPTSILEYFVLESNTQNLTLSSLQRIIVAGEALKISKNIRHFFEKNKHLVLENHYGPSESHVVTALSLSTQDLPWPDYPSIGRPISNTEILILDSQQKLVPIGIYGELYIGGAGLARAYLSLPEKTAEKFIRHPFNPDKIIYRTGDFARFLSDGNIEYKGRIDEQVKFLGYRIELREIEIALIAYPKIEQALVLLKENAENNKQLISYIVTEKNQPLLEADIKKFLAVKLPAYMIPAHIITLNKFPLNIHGKIDKNRLPSPDKNKLTQPTDAISQNKIQKTLLTIWKKLLGVKTISIEDNFFDLGGHSLMTLRLFYKIKTDFGIDLPIRTIFNHPTIISLSHAIQEKIDCQSAEGPLVTLQKKGNKTPLFLIHPVGGTIFWYQNLLPFLKKNRPIYGIEDPGIESAELSFKNFNDMANFYLEIIKKKQPTGPYLLGGASFGGTMSLAIAEQLKKQGEEVESIIMFDSWARYPDDIQDKSFFDHLMRQQVDKLSNELKKAGIKDSEKWIQLQWNRASLVWHYAIPQDISHQIFLFKSTTPPLPSFETSEANQNYWNLYSKNLKTNLVPGSHETMFQEPHIKVLTTKLQSLLDQLD